MNTDRNLLFGVLALQADLIDPEQFAEACSAWSARKNSALADLLVERGWISAEDRADVEKLLIRKLKKHGGDARASLGEITSDHVRRSLTSITDPEIRDSLDGRPAGQGRILLNTVDFTPKSTERYTRSRLHATGGIGRVWLARDQSLERDVALKELLPERADRPALWTRFLMEARITGQLEHPGIVPIYELGQRPGDGQPFYTMRFVRGRTLSFAVEDYHRKRLQRETRPLALRELLTAFVGVCNAVGYAHSRGVLHRDLKPLNVVLGDYGEAIVLDWGLARLIDAPEETGDLAAPAPIEAGADVAATVQGQALGTPAYMSPEQAEGRLDRFGPRTDVYGLGAILYEILTGRPPFAGEETTEVLRQVVHADPRPPRSLAADTPGALEAIALKALAKSPERRYDSAKALAADVERWMADEPVSAWPEPMRVRAGRWVRKHRTGVAAALAALSVAVAGLVGLTAVQAESRQRLAESNRKLAGANLQLAEARDRAEGRVDLALGAVASFRSAVDGNLDVKNRPENEALRKTLLQAPLAFYQKLRDDLKASADASPEGRAKLADAYAQFATLDRDIGSQADALRAYDEAIDLLEPLTLDVALPQRDVIRVRLAGALNDRGELQSVSSSLTPLALESFGRARTILQVGIQEENVAARLELARALGGVAKIEARKGEVDPALATLRESLRVLEEAHRVEPDHPGAALQRADAHLQICAVLHGQRSRIPEALASAEAALGIVEPLARVHPAEADCQLKLAEVYEALASLHESRSEVDKALADYNKRLAVVEALAAANPTVTNYRYHRVLALCSVATSEEDLGRNEKALAALGNARDLAAALVRDNPANVKYKKALGRAWNLMAGPQYALGKVPDALASIEVYAAALADANRSDPGDLGTLRSIASAHYNRGLLNFTLGRTEQAVAAYKQSLQLLERLSQQHPDDTGFAFDAASTLGNIGVVRRNQHDYREAAESFQRAIETLKKLSVAHPENSQFQSYLIRAQLNMGDVLTSLSQTPDAIAILRSAMEASDRMAREHPGVVQYQEDRADGLTYLGTTLRKAGQAKEALATYKLGIEICEGLLRSNPGKPDIRSRLAVFFREQGAVIQEGGRPGDAVQSYRQAVAQLEGIASPSPYHLGELGRCHARLAGVAAAAGSGLPAEAARAEADKALETLRRALAAGFTDAELLRTNGDFDPLRKREDFQKLLHEVEAKAAK